jgi:hypothetical protein
MTRASRVASVGCVLAAFLAAGIAFGQPGGDRPGGGRSRGGMFMGGSGGAPTLLDTAGMLLRAEEVQKELELLDDQKAKLKAVSDEVREEMQKQGEKLRDLSQEERSAKFAELRKDFSAKITAKLNEVLLPHQMERVKQLAVQRLGPMALGDPDVQQKLKITDEQKEKMQAVRESITNSARELFGNRESLQNLDENARRKRFEEMREKFGKLRSEAEGKALEILTADQKDTLEKMKGKKFDFPENMGFGGRRGPGPGGPPRQQ